MADRIPSGGRKWFPRVAIPILAMALAGLAPPQAAGFTLKVVDGNGTPVSGFRWLVERDNSNQQPPGVPSIDSVSLDIHKSHAPVEAAGRTAGSETVINLPNGRRYMVSVLPDSGYALGGASIAPGESLVTVTVQQYPIPTAQISVLAFVDQNPINDGYDIVEQGLGGAQVVIKDFGGPVSQDVYGMPLGTVYNPDGSIAMMGTGTILTLTQDQFDAGPNPYNLQVGEALIKNLSPGKYGVIVIPPNIDDAGQGMDWVQTTTIEGTPTIDAWVKANEPSIFVEGFGTGFKHVIFGYVKTAPTGPSPFRGQVFDVPPWNSAVGPGTGSIEGTLRWNHFARPPSNQGFFAAEPVPEAWVGLNLNVANPAAQSAGLIALPADPATGYFRIDNVPAGTYRLVWWDRPLDGLFGFSTVTVGEGENVVLGDVLVFRWFGTFEGTVFNDLDQDGFRDPGEPGIPEQNINIRFRDGSIYQAQPTDNSGEYSLSEVFPFFKWLVVEVDFARYKATGMTAAVDHGGPVPPADGWVTPSFDKLNPQPQAEVNPNTGNNLSRTETGPVLTQAMHLFLNQVNVVDWGKATYSRGENGGISGIVFYDSTRAENDPQYNGAEPWQPGIPRVQVNLYRDDLDNATGRKRPDGKIDDVNEDGLVRAADVDNFPLGWAGGGQLGDEDVDRNGNGLFDTGDAVQVTWTDSWDANLPSGCIQDLPVIHGQLAPECADAYGTWNQVRPGVFDGGYAFTSMVPTGLASGDPEESPLLRGTYIVEIEPPPGYAVVKEEDKNVDFGDTYHQSPLLLPPVCVGKDRLVPDELTLFPGVPTAFAGQTRPLCDRKRVAVTGRRNAAADFFLFTEVPKAARVVGFVNNDLGAEFNMASPNFGEKIAPSWIPVSIKDWAGKEVVRTYADEYGGYNAMLPSSYTNNIPAPSGVSPGMYTVVLNDPVKADGTLDPYYNPTFSVTPWTFQFMPGTTSYLDTPLVPLAAFARHGAGLDTDPPTLTPVIHSVNGPEAGGGPLLCTANPTRSVTITSVGTVEIFNPDYDPTVLGSPFKITRDYGFGTTEGIVSLEGSRLTVTSWTNLSITATIPPGVISSGRLMVARGDNGNSTEVLATINIVDCATTQVVRVPADYPTIQAAIDAPTTNPGALILVAPGAYNENIILSKPVQLQGGGAGGTFVNANPNPIDRLQLWRDRVTGLVGDAFGPNPALNPLFQNEAPAVLALGEYNVGGTIINPGNPFSSGAARIDGFTLSGSKAGGGVFAAAGADGLVISNNVITNNQGTLAGGVVVGVNDDGLGLSNHGVVIHRNKIHRNGGVQGAGGIGLYDGSDGYLVKANIIHGNLSRFNGGGIAHIGLSPGGTILGNRILFNENFFGMLVNNVGEGGGIYIGGILAGGAGAGSVTIDRNLIQGNLAGSGSGGGIRAFAVNGADVLEAEASWYRLTITNNIIVNNVAALSGAGISLQDVARAIIDNNTVAYNDSSATAALAFTAGQLDSTPQPAGVVSHAHSAALLALLPGGEAGYSDPALVDNIIWNNRSFFNDHTLNGGAGGLAPNPVQPVWDLQVLDVPAPAYLDPDDCILTSLTDSFGADYSDGTNLASDPRFAKAYANSLRSATILDEGGNNITVRFSPLLASAGDYHLAVDSPAIDAGQATGYSPDFDGNVRPGGAAYDIGADEYVAPSFATLAVLTPNGGEVVPAGSVYTIYWGAPATAHHFTVQYSSDAGGTWADVATDITTSFFNWSVPTPTGNVTTASIRVIAFSDVNAELGSDVSDSTFTVEVVKVVSPNGGEVLTGLSSWTIRWETYTTGVASVEVELTRNNGTTWTPLETLTGNPGQYVWTVNDVNNLQIDCRVRVTLRSSGGANIGRDVSDQWFAIRPSLIP